ncbi:MAG: hypothetical protein HY536_00100 [Candidatus Colwellbacteria bacterium]|nr:hypothetical protein [Candidatus Colwellbacteria bacterium]
MNVYAVIFGSILFLTGVAWAARRLLGWRVCPVCAGVAGTWVWIFAGSLAGVLPYAEYRLLVGILAGGSVVGVSYELIGRSRRSEEENLLLKTGFIIAGFGTVAAALSSAWEIVLLLAGALFALGYFMTAPSAGGRRGERASDSSESGAKQKLEQGVKRCCS